MAATNWSRIIGATLLSLAAITGCCGGSSAETQKNSLRPAAPATKSIVRSLHFPGGHSYGQLFLMPVDISTLDKVTPTQIPLATALGDVKVTVPPDKAILIEVDRRVFDYPSTMSRMTTTGIEGFEGQYFAMEESDQQIPDRMLGFLPYFKDLRFIKLSRSDVTDGGITKLVSLKKLERIEAMGTAIHGKCFKDLKSFPNLVWLDFSLSRIEQDNLKYLAELPKLKTLGLRNSQIGNAAIEALSQSHSIEILALSENRDINDGCIPALLKMHQVKNLDLKGTKITAQGLERLQVLSLQKLVLPQIKVSDADLEHIKKIFPHTKIIVRNPPLSDFHKEMFAPVVR